MSDPFVIEAMTDLGEINVSHRRGPIAQLLECLSLEQARAHHRALGAAILAVSDAQRAVVLARAELMEQTATPRGNGDPDARGYPNQ